MGGYAGDLEVLEAARGMPPEKRQAVLYQYLLARGSEMQQLTPEQRQAVVQHLTNYVNTPLPQPQQRGVELPSPKDLLHMAGDVVTAPSRWLREGVDAVDNAFGQHDIGTELGGAAAAANAEVGKMANAAMTFPGQLIPGNDIFDQIRQQGPVAQEVKQQEQTAHQAYPVSRFAGQMVGLAPALASGEGEAGLGGALASGLRFGVADTAAQAGDPNAPALTPGKAIGTLAADTAVGVGMHVAIAGSSKVLQKALGYGGKLTTKVVDWAMEHANDGAGRQLEHELSGMSAADALPDGGAPIVDAAAKKLPTQQVVKIIDRISSPKLKMMDPEEWVVDDVTKAATKILAEEDPAVASLIQSYDSDELTFPSVSRETLQQLPPQSEAAWPTTPDVVALPPTPNMPEQAAAPVTYETLEKDPPTMGPSWDPADNLAPRSLRDLAGDASEELYNSIVNPLPRRVAKLGPAGKTIANLYESIVNQTSILRERWSKLARNALTLYGKKAGDENLKVTPADLTKIGLAMEDRLSKSAYTPVVEKAVHILQKLHNEVYDYADRAGVPGLKRELENYVHHALTPEAREKILREGLSKEEFSRAVDATAKAFDVSPVEAAQRVRDLIDAMRTQSNPLHGVDSPEELKALAEIRGGNESLSRMAGLEKLVRPNPNSDWLSGRMAQLQDATPILKAMWSLEPSTEGFGNGALFQGALQKNRTALLPANFYENDLSKVVSNYVDRAAHIIAMYSHEAPLIRALNNATHTFEGLGVDEPETAKILGVLNADDPSTLWQFVAGKSPEMRDILLLLRNAAGLPAEEAATSKVPPAAATLLSKFIGLAARTALWGHATLANGVQWTMNVAMHGPMATLNGLMDTVTGHDLYGNPNLMGGQPLVGHVTGSTAGSILDDVHFGGNIGQIIDQYDPFSVTERFVRRVGTATALRRGYELAMRAANGDEVAERMLGEFSESPLSIIREAMKLTELMGRESVPDLSAMAGHDAGQAGPLLEYALNSTRHVSLPAERAAAPRLWTSNELMRVLSIFQRFGVSQTYMVLDGIRYPFEQAVEAAKAGDMQTARKLAEIGLKRMAGFGTIGLGTGLLVVDPAWKGITGRWHDMLVNQLYHALTDPGRENRGWDTLRILANGFAQSAGIGVAQDLLASLGIAAQKISGQKTQGEHGYQVPAFIPNRIASVFQMAGATGRLLYRMGEYEFAKNHGQEPSLYPALREFGVASTKVSQQWIPGLRIADLLTRLATGQDKRLTEVIDASQRRHRMQQRVSADIQARDITQLMQDSLMEQDTLRTLAAQKLHDGDFPGYMQLMTSATQNRFTHNLNRMRKSQLQEVLQP